MGTKEDSTGSPKGQIKRRRVGFSDKDAGIEANECIRIYLELLPKSGVNGQGSSSQYLLEENSTDVEVFRVRGTWLGNLYCRLVPLVLLLIDGSNPIDVTCPRWEIYILTRRNQNDMGMCFLGFAAVYRFHKYPTSTRLRLGQILIMPTCQRNGFGSLLLKVLTNVAISEDLYDFTIEEPVDVIQHVRTCIDVERLLTYGPLHDTLTASASRLRHQKSLTVEKPACRYAPSADFIEAVRKSFKITKRQFLNCWEILLYLKVVDQGEEGLQNYATYLRNRVENEVIGEDSEGSGKAVINIPSDFDADASFVMFKVKGEQSISLESADELKRTSQEETLRQLVDERMKEIRAVVEKISQKPK